MTKLTTVMVRLGIDLNCRTCALFDLAATEVKLTEETTKYRYGEV